MIGYSKKIKLPKSKWEKGKSKFLFCRLAEEERDGFKFWRGKEKSQSIVRPDKLKMSWWQRMKVWVLKVFKKGITQK